MATKSKKLVSRVNQEKELKDLIQALKNNCKDAAFFDSTIKKIMSLKGQLDIDPTLLHIPMSDVVKIYDFKFFRVIRTKKEFVYHQNGYYLIVKPWMQTLYGQLDAVCAYEDEVKDEDKMEMYDSFKNTTLAVLGMPTMAFSDPDFFFDIAIRYMTFLNKKVEESLSEVQDEDESANEQFKEETLMAEALAQALAENKEEN